jgi:hypothetical protein
MTAEVTPDVSRFLGTIAGSPFIEIFLVRVKNAMGQLEAAGISPRAVSPQTLSPLIERAYLEDDDSMGDRWASLLANAASGKRDVRPSFPGILRKLEPTAAGLLDAIYQSHMQLAPQLRPYLMAKISGEIELLGLTNAEFESHMDCLARLRLISARQVTGPDIKPQSVSLTEFGLAFVKACRPLGRPDPQIVWTDRRALQRHIHDRERRRAEKAVQRAVEPLTKHTHNTQEASDYVPHAHRPGSMVT